MAGIEKICEYSGEYVGHEMYCYKKSQLQILPKYRKLFRGAKHKLLIKEIGLVWDKGYCYTDYDDNEWKEYEPPFLSEKEFINWRKCCGIRLIKEYQYTLIVFDKNLQGNVNGKYINWTYDLPATKRKLQRLLRCEKLNIEYTDEEIY